MDGCMGGWITTICWQWFLRLIIFYQLERVEIIKIQSKRWLKMKNAKVEAKQHSKNDPVERQVHQFIHSFTHSSKMVWAPTTHRHQDGAGVAVSCWGPRCGCGLDLDHEVSLGLTKFWPGVTLAKYLSMLDTYQPSRIIHCPLSPHEGNTTLMGKSLEADLPSASSRLTSL